MGKVISLQEHPVEDQPISDDFYVSQIIAYFKSYESVKNRDK